MFESELMGSVFELDLKTVSVAFKIVQVDAVEYLCGPAVESSGKVGKPGSQNHA